VSFGPFDTTKALGTSPDLWSGTPMTAASATPGWLRSMSSSSAGATCMELVNWWFFGTSAFVQTYAFTKINIFWVYIRDLNLTIFYIFVKSIFMHHYYFNKNIHPLQFHCKFSIFEQN
jgi:hypothetical protein